MFLFRQQISRIIRQSNGVIHPSNRIRYYATESSDKKKKSSENNEQNQSKALITRGVFENIANKNKQSYLDMVHIFEGRDIHRRGHVEFIYAAMRNMEEFGVNKDLEVYKALIDVLPKGKFIPTNIFQAEFMHYPKQQQCAIDLLEQMEDNGIIRLIRCSLKRNH